MPNHKTIESTITLTSHAVKRARQRYRWTSETLQRMAVKAFDSSLKRKNTCGYLKNYIDNEWESHKTANNIRLYGEMIFIFSNHNLITVWPLPTQFRSLAKVFRQKIQKPSTPGLT